MKKTFTIILSIIFLASCADISFNKTKKLISDSSSYDIESLSKIEDKISKSHYSIEQANEIRLLYTDYINNVGKRITDSINDLLYNAEVDYLEVYDNTKILSEKLQNYGIVLDYVEGSIYYEILPLHVYNLFQKYLTQYEQMVASIQQKEIEEPILIDAGIVVPCSEIANRLHETELIIQEYNDTSNMEIHEYKQRYMILLMFGSDNTPAFDWYTHEMNEDFKNEIINYINEYPDSPCSKIFSEYIQILSKTNFKENKESRKFIEKLIKSFY
ncbi:MAG: hypothetical protein PUC14_00190 [Bacteroidales bacterium]|nr:hypothetical protein [Bacteroidales bacterium]MDD5974148.1 hypothetical protein [Bacteroidales bacterium]MDY5193780.1 hypothetical protein [Candidatus Aphodosoma sp.]